MDMSSGLHADSASLVRYLLSSGEPDTLGFFPVRERFVTLKGGSRSMGERPFGVVGSAAVHGDRIFLDFGGVFDLLALTAEGQPAECITARHTPRPVLGGDRARYVEWRTSRFRGSEAFAARAREVLSSEAAPYPHSMPAYDRLLVDEDEGLWVRHYQPPWELAREVWSVFTVSGHWLGVLTGPPGLEILQVGRDFVLGIARDSLDVERIRLHRLERH